MLWVLTETWGKDIVCQKGFLRKLFISPRPVIDWQWYLELTPLSRYEYDHIPPTICIYDVKKKVEDVDENVDSEEEDDGDENNVDDDYFEDAGDDDNDYEGETLSYYHHLMSADDDVVDDGSSSDIIRDLSKPRISVEEARKILSSDHKFSVDDSRKFLDKFP